MESQKLNFREMLSNLPAKFIKESSMTTILRFLWQLQCRKDFQIKWMNFTNKVNWCGSYLDSNRTCKRKWKPTLPTLRTKLLEGFRKALRLDCFIKQRLEVISSKLLFPSLFTQYTLLLSDCHKPRRRYHLASLLIWENCFPTQCPKNCYESKTCEVISLDCVFLQLWALVSLPLSFLAQSSGKGRNLE